MFKWRLVKSWLATVVVVGVSQRWVVRWLVRVLPRKKRWGNDKTPRSCQLELRHRSPRELPQTRRVSKRQHTTKMGVLRGASGLGGQLRALQLQGLGAMTAGGEMEDGDDDDDDNDDDVSGW